MTEVSSAEVVEVQVDGIPDKHHLQMRRLS